MDNVNYISYYDKNFRFYVNYRYILSVHLCFSLKEIIDTTVSEYYYKLKLMPFIRETSQMVIECISILIIISALVLAFLRAHRKKYAFSIIPLIILPAMNLISYPLSAYLSYAFGILEEQTRNSIIVAALVVSCIALGMMSSNFSIKKNRHAYIIICGVYTLILSLIFILK